MVSPSTVGGGTGGKAGTARSSVVKSPSCDFLTHGGAAMRGVCEKLLRLYSNFFDPKYGTFLNP